MPRLDRTPHKKVDYEIVKRQTRQSRLIKKPIKPTYRKDGHRSNEHYKPELIRAALMKSRGMIAIAAKLLKCDRSTVANALERHPELKQVCASERELMTDTAELKLFQAINKGEAWAVCFYLKTQAKHRGFIERSEITGGGGAPLIDLAGTVKAAADEARDLLARFFARARATKVSRQTH